MAKGDTLDEAIRQRTIEFHQDLDKLCAEAVVSQEGGVRIIWGQGLSYEMKVDPTVPFGEIYEVLP